MSAPPPVPSVTRAVSVRPRAAPSGGRRGGLTLVEVVVVLAVMAMIAALAVPAFAPPYESGARAVARQIADVYAEARASAAARAVPVHVVIDPGTGRYAAVTRGAGGAPGDTVRRGRIEGVDGVRMSTAGADRITAAFDPLGRGRVPEITVIGEKDEHVHVQIDAWTGRVRIRRR